MNAVKESSQQQASDGVLSRVPQDASILPRTPLINPAEQPIGIGGDQPQRITDSPLNVSQRPISDVARSWGANPVTFRGPDNNSILQPNMILHAEPPVHTEEKKDTTTTTHTEGGAAAAKPGAVDTTTTTHTEEKKEEIHGNAEGEAALNDPLKPLRDLETKAPAGIKEMWSATVAEEMTDGLPHSSGENLIGSGAAIDAALVTGIGSVQAGFLGGLWTGALDGGRKAVRWLLGKRNYAAREAAAVLMRGKGLTDPFRNVSEFFTRKMVRGTLSRIGRMRELLTIAANPSTFSIRTPLVLGELYNAARFAKETALTMIASKPIDRFYDAASNAIIDQLSSVGNLSAELYRRLTVKATDLQKALIEEKYQAYRKWENFKLNAKLTAEKMLGAFPIVFGAVAGAHLIGAAKDAVVNWWNSDWTKFQMNIMKGGMLYKYGIPGGWFWSQPIFEPVRVVGQWVYNNLIVAPLSFFR